MARRVRLIAQANRAINARVSTTRRLDVSLTPKCNYLARMYWRNILEVVREEQLRGMRAEMTALPRAVRDEFQAPSVDGLEVVELTVLDVSL